jgi:hypothetical protein
LAEILIAHPQTRGVLYDHPHVVSTAGLVLASAGLHGHYQIVAGDMFESVPGDCDAYVMKYVMHDWDEGDALRILATCRRDMPGTARLMLIERFVGPPNKDSAGKFADLSMLEGPGGQERTREELAAMLRKGGFRVVDVLATGAPLFVTVAERGRT